MYLKEIKKILWNINYIRMRRKLSMRIGCNIWMICLEFFYDPSRILQLSEFVGTLRSSVVVVFNNFLLIDATDRSKISSDQKRLFFAVSLIPLPFFSNTPFKIWRLYRYNFFINWHLNYSVWKPDLLGMEQVESVENMCSMSVPYALQVEL